MRTSDAGIRLIAEFESFSSVPYRCPANVPTIGYGTTIYPNGRRVTDEDEPITKEIALSYLKNMVDYKYEEIIDRFVQVPLTQGMYDALVAFVYNVGETAFKNSTLLKELNKKHYFTAYKELDKWVKAKGKTLKGLMRRRDAEQALWVSNNNPVREE